MCAYLFVLTISLQTACFYFMNVQAAVTEHVVLRGSYKSLTLVIYGNLASELSSDHNLDPDVFLSAEATSLQQHLQDTDTETATVPQSLHLVVPPSAEQVDLLKRLLQCVDPKDTTHQLVPALLAAAVLHGMLLLQSLASLMALLHLCFLMQVQSSWSCGSGYSKGKMRAR
jgi:hypothetical protein